MKKRIALLMCAVMLLSTVATLIPAFADTPAPKTAGGPLAITEICYNPAEEPIYEYIEVLNTSDDAVNLKNYSIYRTGFSNSGRYGVEGLQQLLGLTAANQNPAHLHKLSMAAIDQSVAAGETVLIWPASAAAYAKTVDDFKAYWGRRNVDLTNVTVVKLPAYTQDGSSFKDVAPASVITTNAGTTFLPDAHAGFVISLIANSYADTDDMAKTKAKQIERLGQADSTAFAILPKKSDANLAATTDKVLEYYAFADATKYQAALDAGVTFPSEITNDAKKLTATATELYASIVVPKRTDSTKENVNVWITYADSACTTPNSGLAFIAQPEYTTPTPGALYNGQFGSQTTATPTVPTAASKDPVAKAERTSLAITEVCYNPTDARYEYLEIMNTGDTAVNLKDYYVYRNYSSNTLDKWYVTGFLQMLGVTGKKNNDPYTPLPADVNTDVKVPLTSYDQTINKDDVVLLWFASANAATNTVEDFKAYWTAQGANMTNVTVVKVVVYSENNGTYTNKYPATLGTNREAGDTFLPDKKAAFVISIINANYARNDDVNIVDGVISKTTEKTRERLAMADSTAWAVIEAGETSRAVDFYSYINETAYNNAINALTFTASEATPEAYYAKAAFSELGAGLMTGKKTTENLENVKIWADTGNTKTVGEGDAAETVQANNSSLAFLDNPEKVAPTPGKLRDGQMGYTVTKPTATPKTAGGPLAITEVCYNPDDYMYEYIEVMNVGQTAINLKDYSIYRHAYSNGGNQHLYNGTLAAFGFEVTKGDETAHTQQNLGKLVKLSLAAYDVEIAAGETVILWLAPSGVASKSVDTFKSKWTAQGNDMTDVKVVKVAVYVASEGGNMNLYPASDINQEAGVTFLPDKKAGVWLALIENSYADHDDEMTVSPELMRERNAVADSIVSFILEPNETDKSVNTYGYIDKTAYTSALADVVFPSGVAANLCDKITADEIPASLLVCKKGTDGKEQIGLYSQKPGANIECTIAFIAQLERFEPTPGKLTNGQFGYVAPEGDGSGSGNEGSGSGSAGGGAATDDDIIQNVKPSNKNDKNDKTDETDETEAETEAVTDTAAPETEAPAENSGCGSVVGATAFAVIAPTLVMGCGLAFNKKRRGK